MVRKGNFVAVVLGFVLLCLAFPLFFSFFWQGAIFQRPVAFFAFFAVMAVLSVAIVCFWWPLFHRAEPPLGFRFRIAIRIVGVLYLGIVLAIAAALAWYGRLYVIPLAPPFVMHLLIGSYLFCRPRLLLPWSLSVLIVLPFLLFIGVLWIGSMGSTVLAMLYPIGSPPLGLLIGPLIALPVAWLWVVRADQPLGLRRPKMVRKGNCVAVVLGFVLLCLAFSLVFSFFWQGAISKRPVAFFAVMAVSSVAIVCFWWPLFHRAEPPLGFRFRIAIRIVGVLYLGIVLAIAAALVWWAGRLSVIWAPPFVMHLLIGSYLLRRPRLLLPWSLSVLIMLAFLLFIGVLCLPPDSIGAMGAAMLRAGHPLRVHVMGSIPLGLLIGPLIALPVAWLWVVRAERSQLAE